jgi:hypothetical protein
MLMNNWARFTVVVLLALALPLTASAEDKKRTVFPKTGQDEGSDAIPAYTGKGKVTEAVNTKTGAIFDIGGGITMTFPKGLPVGESRLLTLKTTTDRPAPAQIARRFERVGATLHFNGALNTARSPIVLALGLKRTPEKSGYKLVIAIEEAGLCTKESKGSKLGHGLCSTWRTVDVRYDSTEGKIVANLTSTGGYRLQFGLVPQE